jgi:hypothetical protein
MNNEENWRPLFKNHGSQNVKLARLLLVSERDWRKVPAEAGARTAEKVARRNLNFFAGVVLKSRICATTPRKARHS